MRNNYESKSTFLHRKMRWVSLRIVNDVDNQSSCPAKLHWTKAEGDIGTECLLEYSPA